MRSNYSGGKQKKMIKKKICNYYLWKRKDIIVHWGWPLWSNIEGTITKNHAHLSGQSTDAGECNVF